MAEKPFMAKKILEEYKRITWMELKRLLKDPDYPKVFKIPAKYKNDVAKYWEMIRAYPERQGKYLRPTLLLLTTEAMGCKRGKAINTAVAMQLSEEWLLIHDDFQDHSTMRRGKPALHKIYGPELAINAGNSLHIIMWKAIMNNKSILGNEKTFRIAEEFYKTLLRTAHGQAVEIQWSNKNKIDFSDEDWFFVADGKTSYYTIATPMRLGAIIAGANNEELESITKFGKYLGRCFQLVDDILDVTTDYKGQGLGSDIFESKRTMILSHLIKNSKGADRKKTLSIISKPGEQKSKEDVAWIIQKMNEVGSIEYSKAQALKLKEKSQEIFEKELTFLSHQPTRDKLEMLIRFILERDH